MKAPFLTAAAITVVMAGSAHADYYVVENQSTHKCTVVNQEPMSGMIDTLVGNEGYRSQQEAETAMRSALACANTPMGIGSKPTSGPIDRGAIRCGNYLAPWPCRR
jgi:hypothetical protein